MRGILEGISVDGEGATYQSRKEGPRERSSRNFRRWYPNSCNGSGRESGNGRERSGDVGRWVGRRDGEGAGGVQMVVRGWRGNAGGGEIMQLEEDGNERRWFMEEGEESQEREFREKVVGDFRQEGNAAGSWTSGKGFAWRGFETG